jgi:hypothetical protein
MKCETSVRLHQQILEAKIAIQENKKVEDQIEKTELLLTAKVNVWEHEHACVICCPLQPLPPSQKTEPTPDVHRVPKE